MDPSLSLGMTSGVLSKAGDFRGLPGACRIRGGGIHAELGGIMDPSLSLGMTSGVLSEAGDSKSLPGAYRRAWAEHAKSGGMNLCGDGRP